MNQITFAKISERRFPIADEKGFQKFLDHVERLSPWAARENLEAEIKENCGTYLKGKNKGKLRGWATVEVVDSGGWQILGQGAGNGRVLLPGTVPFVGIFDYEGNCYFSAGRSPRHGR
jgi:hypothetical protein